MRARCGLGREGEPRRFGKFALEILADPDLSALVSRRPRENRHRIPMSPILQIVRDRELRRFDTGDIVVEQGTASGELHFLVEGRVEVLKDGVQVAVASESGVVFGEMSAFLGGPHTATVRALEPCSFFIVEDPSAFLEATPQACLQICELLARRLDAVNRYLVDVKQQFEGHDHIGLVGDVLHTLMHRHPAKRIRPRDSTIRQSELSD